MVRNLTWLVRGPVLALEVDPDGSAARLIRHGMILFFVSFICGGLWLSLAPLAGAIVAQGVLKPEDVRKTVQHLEGGIVREIYVKEGQHVRAGQALLLLADTQADATLSVLQDQLDAEQAKATRLSAEATLARSMKLTPALQARAHDTKVAEMLANEQAMFHARLTSMEGLISVLRSQMSQVKGELHGLAEQIRFAEEGIAYLQQQLEANESLYKKDFVNRSRVLDFRRALAEKSEKHGEYLANRAVASQKISELELRIIMLRNNYQQDAINELKETKKRIFDLQDRLRPTADAVRRLTVRAPVSGQVLGLRHHTVGAVVIPREALLDIAPDESRMMVEAKIRPADIAHIKTGQRVEMRLTAFNRRSTPIVEGRVKFVSADSLVDSPLNGGQNYYLAQVELTPEAITQLKARPLSAGMPVEAYFNAGKRTALEYLFDPVLSSMDRAFKEP